MNWKNVKLIFSRELRDQLRDRRTLFMVLLLPLLLYPLTLLTMAPLTTMFTEQPREILVIGQEHLPDEPALLVEGEAGYSFNPALFSKPENAKLLIPILESVGDQDPVEYAKAQLEQTKDRAYLIIPADVQQNIDANEQFQFIQGYNAREQKSHLAHVRLSGVLSRWEQSVVELGLEKHEVPSTLAHPMKVTQVDLASTKNAAGTMVWSRLFPFLLVVMALTGAFHPAVDICAGEKERGTMETLLISPAARSEIVVGKFMTVWLFSVVTAMVNLLAMSVTGAIMAEQFGSLGGGVQTQVLAPPSPLASVWMACVLLPLSAFFSAIGVALAAFARSSREGQYYLTPLFLLTMPLVLVTMVPGIELNSYTGPVPVTGAALLLAALLQGKYALAIQYVVPVLLPIVMFAAMALQWAIDQFNREEVLFRSAERVDFGLWVKHMFRDRESLPSGGQAILCYVIMLLMMCALLMTGGFIDASATDEDSRRTAIQKALIYMQIIIVATPALMMAVVLTRRPLQSLLFRKTPWKCLGVAICLVFALHPLMMELNYFIEKNGPPVPEALKETLQFAFSPDQPLWIQIFLIAFLPAVCEEVAFRGFILSGLTRRISIPLAIMLNGLLFGLFHMTAQQLLPATFLGIMLGIIAVRSGSLLPCVFFHFINNSVVVVRGHFHAKAQAMTDPDSTLVRVFSFLDREIEPGHYGYNYVILGLGIVASALCVTWFLKQPNRSPSLVGRRDRPSNDEPSENTSPLSIARPSIEV